ncbi:multidrug effflux MFS transporter [Halosquirtibacter xylanolyticus]|uniref:multidrug effflux MFS transporter n=1 Tax=Halosquirtibacter xylanolyticus TaxID=3374599 RepID=UPI003749AB8C|nr:multidrug effflux MFS transporter [Prolixibacteraceae bacterium]
MSVKKISDFEFISLMASLMAIASLSLDAILPALNNIGLSIGITDPKDNQLLITTIFLGMGVGQLISGALSDSLGRKPVVYIGYIIFAIASVVCVCAVNLEMMVAGRLLQGVGLSAPRSVTMSIVRDKYEGNYMARIMSFVSVIFILVPIVAPFFGKLMLDAFGWQSIFYSQIIFGFCVMVWLWRRQEETLTDENKKKVTLSLFTDGVREFFKHREAVIYTIVIGIVTAPFLSYISSSQQIFQEQYNLVEEYTYIFSGLAIVIGVATYLNGILVLRLGMLRLVMLSLVLLSMTSLVYVICYSGVGNPPIMVLVAFLSLILFSTGFIVGNINALAMQPIGHIAGIGAAIVGFISTIITILLTTIIGQYINMTALPIFIGFTICGSVTLFVVLVMNRSKNVIVTNS